VALVHDHCCDVITAQAVFYRPRLGPQRLSPWQPRTHTNVFPLARSPSDAIYISGAYLGGGEGRGDHCVT
jgi:hypothetical protein